MIRNLIHRAKYELLGTQWVPVLMYHSIVSKATRNWGPWQYAVTPDRFNRQISYISQEYEPIALSRIIDDTPLPDDGVILTFDDGFRDTLTTALPILEKYEVPATVYMTTGFLSEYNDPFEYAVAETLEKTNYVGISVNGLHLEQPLLTDEATVRAYDEIKQWGMHANRKDRRNLLSQLPSTETTIEMLTETDVEELSTHPLITVGAHGRDHLPLTTRGRSAIKTDIQQCQERLELLTDTSINHFTYPYGEFNDEVISVLKELDFMTAATTRPADFVLDSNVELQYEIPRFDASNGLGGVL